MSLDQPLGGDLYVVGPSGALEHLGASQRPQSRPTRFAWSKDGRRLAVADETFRVFELDASSTHTFEMQGVVDLRWSASGEYLVIWGDGLAIASRSRVLLDMPGKTADAQWSPDGQRVSYAGARGLELISVDGERGATG